MHDEHAQHWLSVTYKLLPLLMLLLQMLHTAKQDERVRGVLAVLGGRENFGGMAQLQELRNALLDFRVRPLCHQQLQKATEQQQQQQQQQLWFRVWLSPIPMD
jgi:hypothetical protein